MMRDARGLVSLLWYKDLGEVSLIGKRGGGKSGFLGLITSGRHNFSLHIHRSNGSIFLSLTDQVDDSVKEAIYDFLLRQKIEATS